MILAIDPLDFWLRFALPLIIMAGLGLIGALHAATRPDSSWEAAGQSKLLWIILNVVLTFLAAVPYFLIVAPKLRRAAKSRVGV